MADLTLLVSGAGIEEALAKLMLLINKIKAKKK